MWQEIGFGSVTSDGPRGTVRNPDAHRVPLSSRALQVLEGPRRHSEDGLVFPSSTNRVLSVSTLSKLVREDGVLAVPYALCTSFRVWCGDIRVAGGVRRRSWPMWCETRWEQPTPEARFLSVGGR